MKSKISFGKLKDMQSQIASQFSADDEIKIDEIKYIAGFDATYFGNKCVCSAVVLDFKTLQVVEKKFLVTKTPMNYVPGFLAFREGPPICQAYFDLEHEPDVLMVDGHGIAHPMKCGLATFVGVELSKPCIGIAKSLLVGEEKDGQILLDGEIVGKTVKTKEHANALFVSPGNFISIETAAEIVKKCVIPPHKMPEPLHAAHRYADKIAEEHKNDPVKEKVVEAE
ncbi:MAG TPA: endonuclease V [Candidatus Nanoarchaeia archaeon]|nr:endonuclease V [Candidatus Nanoarchaeia archaeon]